MSRPLLDEQGISDLVDEVQYHEKQVRIVAKQGQEVKADLSQLKGCSDSLVTAFSAYVQLLELSSNSDANTNELRSARQRKDDSLLAYERVAHSLTQHQFDFASYLRGDDDPLGPPSPGSASNVGSAYEVKFLREQLESTRQRSDELRDEVASLKASLNEAHRETRDAQSKAQAASVKADDDRRIESLERQLAALESGGRNGASAQQLEQDLQQARGVVSQLTQENKILQGKLASQQQEQSQLQDRYNLLEQELQRRSQTGHGVYGNTGNGGMGTVHFGHPDGQLVPVTNNADPSGRSHDSQQISVLIQRNRALERTLAEKDLRIRMLEEDKVRLSDRAAGQPGAMNPGAIQELKEIRSMYEEMQSVSRTTINDLEAGKARLMREKAELELQLASARQELARLRAGGASTGTGVNGEPSMLGDQDREALRQDLLESQSDVEKIRKELSAWKLEREDMAGQLDQYYVKLAQADKEIQVYKSRIAEQESYIELVTNTHRSGLNEQALSVRMEAVVSSLRTRLRELEQEILERDSDAIKTQHAQSRLHGVIVEKEEEITRLRARVSTLEQQQKPGGVNINGIALDTSLQADHAGDSKGARQQVEALRRTIGTQETHIRMLTDQLAEARDKVQRLQSNSMGNETLRTQSESSQKRVVELETQLRKVTDELTESQFKCARLSQDNSNLQGRLEAMETSMKALGEDRNSGMSRLGELQREVQEARGEGSALQKECEKRGAHIVSLEELVNNLKSEIAQLQQQQRLAQDRERELLGRQEKMAEQAESYCKEVYTELANTKRQHQHESETAQAERARMKQILDETQAKLQVAQREQTRLENESRDAGHRSVQEAHQLQLQLQEKSSQLQQCQNELASLRPEKASLQAQLQDVTTRAEQAASQHREALAKSELTNSATIASLRKELELLQEQQHETKKARDQAMEELQKTRTNADESSKTLSAQARQQISALEQQLYAMVAELDKANALLVQAHQREAALERELDTFRTQGVHQLNDAQVQLQQFKQELDNRSGKYRQVDEGLNQVQNQAGEMYQMLAAIWKRLQGGQNETVGVQVEMFEGTRTGGEVHQMRTPELRGSLLDSQLHLRQISSQHDEMARRAHEKERELQETMSRMKKLTDHLDDARQQVGDITVQRNSAELEVSRLRREVDRLRASASVTAARSPGPASPLAGPGSTTGFPDLNSSYMSTLGFPTGTAGLASQGGYVPRKYQ